MSTLNGAGPCLCPSSNSFFPLLRLSQYEFWTLLTFSLPFDCCSVAKSIYIVVVLKVVFSGAVVSVVIPKLRAVLESVFARVPVKG